jgi:hypothetical protein
MPQKQHIGTKHAYVIVFCPTSSECFFDTDARRMAPGVVVGGKENASGEALRMVLANGESGAEKICVFPNFYTDSILFFLLLRNGQRGPEKSDFI